MVSEPRSGTAHLSSTAKNNKKMEMAMENRLGRLEQQVIMLTEGQQALIEGSRALKEQVESMANRWEKILDQKMEELFIFLQENELPATATPAATEATEAAYTVEPYRYTWQYATPLAPGPESASSVPFYDEYQIPASISISPSSAQAAGSAYAYGGTSSYYENLGQVQNTFSMSLPSLGVSVGGNLNQHFGDSKINPNDQKYFLNDYYGNQNSVNFSQQQIPNAPTPLWHPSSGHCGGTILKDNDDGEDDVDDFDGFSETQSQFGHWNVEDEIDEEGEKLLKAFLSKGARPQRTLADVIVEKIREKDAKASSGVQPVPELDNSIMEMYKRVGKLLSKYTAGKLPKAFKHVPSLQLWGEVLYLTEPVKWSPNAMYQATRIYASKVLEKLGLVCMVFDPGGNFMAMRTRSTLSF